jgi:hypothetical protein
MKRGHVMKEEISVYFRIAFQRLVAAGAGLHEVVPENNGELQASGLNALSSFERRG